jgi:hypothetical protein
MAACRGESEHSRPGVVNHTILRYQVRRRRHRRLAAKACHMS